MSLRVSVTTALLIVCGANAYAQTVEVQPFVGGRFGGGVTVDEPIFDGTRPLDLNLESGFTWGFTIGFLLGDPGEVEFMLSRQESAISAEAAGLEETTLFDAAVSQYHGNFLFHFRPRDSAFRPYALVGLGATKVDPDAEIEGVTKFSWGLGAGVKSYFNDHLGARLQFRWTPTYVSAEPALFCDVFGFCYVVEEADYLNQIELTAGLTARF